MVQVLPPVLPDLLAPVAPDVPEVLAVADGRRVLLLAQQFLLVLVRPAGPGPDRRAPAMSELPDNVTVRITVRIDIRRLAVGSFDPGRLSELTGIPEATLLTPFDTWDDDDVDRFLDAMCDDHESWGTTNRDDSRVNDYYITRKEGT
jgi:hypothetical protein